MAEEIVFLELQIAAGNLKTSDPDGPSAFPSILHPALVGQPRGKGTRVIIGRTKAIVLRPDDTLANLDDW